LREGTLKMSATFYALGRVGDPEWMVGYIHENILHWEMSRPKFEQVISGQAGKHCETCTCSEQSTDGYVIEDAEGTRYTKMEFAMVILTGISGEVRQ
jgi:hypothetical protein